MCFAVKSTSQRLQNILPFGYDPAAETGEDHKNRLFLQILLGLAVNIVALIGVFYFLIPLSDEGRVTGGVLLWGGLAITAAITALFLKFGSRVFCVNLLLLTFTGLLLGSSFILGGVMSPTMIFLLVIPVLARTLLNSGWAFCWTAATVAAWLLIFILESKGVEMARITRESNVAVVQLVSLLGTVLVAMAVLGSYVAATGRLREEMEKKTVRLDYLARYDSLTSVPNRRAFFEHAEKCLQRSSRSGKPFALLVMDLNDFKQINDRLGHKVGDAVLQHFAQRLNRGFRGTDFIGRLGGDEFGVVLEPVENRASVDIVVQRFLDATENTVTVGDAEVCYTCAIGISLYREQGDSIVDLYEAADEAMYRSKRAAPTEMMWR